MPRLGCTQIPTFEFTFVLFFGLVILAKFIALGGGGVCGQTLPEANFQNKFSATRVPVGGWTQSWCPTVEKSNIL